MVVFLAAGFLAAFLVVVLAAVVLAAAFFGAAFLVVVFLVVDFLAVVFLAAVLVVFFLAGALPAFFASFSFFSGQSMLAQNFQARPLLFIIIIGEPQELQFSSVPKSCPICGSG